MVVWLNGNKYSETLLCAAPNSTVYSSVYFLHFNSTLRVRNWKQQILVYSALADKPEALWKHNTHYSDYYSLLLVCFYHFLLYILGLN